MQDNSMNFERPETLYSGERVMERNGKIQDLIMGDPFPIVANDVTLIMANVIR